MLTGRIKRNKVGFRVIRLLQQEIRIVLTEILMSLMSIITALSVICDRITRFFAMLRLICDRLILIFCVLRQLFYLLRLSEHHEKCPERVKKWHELVMILHEQ